MSLAGRILVSTWCLYSIVVTAIYSGNLIAFLTVPVTDLPFSTLEEMVEQTQYTYGTTGGTYLQVLFQVGMIKYP